MTVRASIEAARPEAARIASLSEAAFGEEGVTVALDERGPDRFVVALYFEEAPDRVERRVRDRLGTDVFGAPLAVETLPDADWVQEGLSALPPVSAGRFVVHGSHDRGRVPPGRIAIEVDAGLAFGTGHHGTTLGCLEALDGELRRRRPRRVLDLGTGSGVLAIACALAARVPVVAADIDAQAVEVASENARRARAAGLVETVVSDGVLSATIRRNAPYDLVLANILAGPLVRMAPALGTMVAPAGTILLSGLLPKQRERVVAAYRGQGLHLSRAMLRDGWATLVMRRPSGRRTGIGARSGA